MKLRLPHTGGIYRFWCTNTLEEYIGSTVDSMYDGRRTSGIW